MGRLTDRIAVVVGGGQTPGETIGNGRATALRFAQEGARVLVVDRRLDSAEETVAMIREAGGDASPCEADITRAQDCARFVAQCLDQYGRIDILHNNVGIGAGDRSAATMTEAVWDRIFDVNMKGIMLSCREVLKPMREQGHGVITNISSVAAVCAVGIVAYKTSKAALNAYTHALATGNAKYNIRANVIMPGLMNTPMAIEGYVAQGADRAELIARRDAAVPLGGRMGTAWDVANAALFLASDEARFITGVCLPVDGGQAAMIG
ncbi:MAG: SDR family oxidoreductase [Pseudomonadales bacterium]|nr:SDR family oxidoreductase [Pseudomonadales bacterium]MCP5183228.1 SDR family oxidoreductase [Pseudomonadales bacterium]